MEIENDEQGSGAWISYHGLLFITTIAAADAAAADVASFSRGSHEEMMNRHISSVPVRERQGWRGRRGGGGVLKFS
jgi:hypothetical protein